MTDHRTHRRAPLWASRVATAGLGVALSWSSAWAAKPEWAGHGEEGPALREPPAHGRDGGPSAKVSIPTDPAAVGAQAVSDAAAEGVRPLHGFVVGAALSSGRDPIGSEGTSWRLQPVWGLWMGRFRLSSGGAAGLWNVGREAVIDPGLSTTVVSDSNWSLGASLHWDDGRAANDDDPRLRGLPAVRKTLRGRVSLGYAFAPRWSLSARVSQDLLGRGGGTQMSADLTYRRPVSAGTHWDVSAGFTAGSAAYRDTRYGIAPDVAQAVGRAAYRLGAGPESLRLGWRITSAIDHDWVVFGGIGFTRLLGAAAQSPLVGSRQVWGASIGVAYRR